MEHVTKILFMSPVSEFKGGAERSISLLIKALIDKNAYSAYLSVSDAGKLRDELDGYVVATFVCGAEIFDDIKREDNLFDAFNNFLKLIKIAKKYSTFIRGNNIDIVHSNGIKTHVLSVLIKLFCPKIKVVWHVRDIFVKKMHKFVFSALQLFSDRIIVVSSACQRNFVFANRKIRVIKNPIPVINNLRNMPFRKINLKIGVVGRISPYKGQVDAVILLNILVQRGLDVQLDIYGQAEEKDSEYFNRLLNIVKKYKLNERVAMRGFVSDMDQIYSSLDLVVVLSPLPDPSPRVVYEALSRRIPVFGYNSGGISETYAKTDQVYLVGIGELNKLSCLISGYLENEKVRMAYAKDIEIQSSYIKKEHSSSAHVNNVIDVYDELINGY